MAYGGQPGGCPGGDPEKHILWQQFSLSGDGTYADYKLQASPNCGDMYYGLYIDSRLAKVVYLTEGESKTARVTMPWGTGSVSYQALAHGQISDPGFSVANVARFVEGIDDANERANVRFYFVPEVMDDLGDQDSALSGWSLSGLSYEHVSPVQGFKNRGTMAASLSVSGSSATVTLYLGSTDGTALATGTGTVGATVTLSESNSSGLSGTVDVAAGAATDETVELYVRWPKEMLVLRDQADPPTTEVARVEFEGDNFVTWTEPSDLSSGTYFYRLRPNSDTDDLGTVSGTLQVEIGALPEPPTALVYQSGNVTNTVLGFSGSSTVGATYRLYNQREPTDLIEPGEPDATAAAGATTVSMPLTSGFSGVVYAMLRAVHPTSGLEDRNTDMEKFEYDQFGTFIPARPNSPHIVRSSVSVTSGLDLSLRATYDPTDEAGTATTIRLFTRTQLGSYDYDSPADTQTISQGADGVSKVTLTHTFAAAGFHYARVLAYTAGGTSSRLEDAGETLVFASDQDMPAASGFSAFTGRA